jgi:choice-of-anchor A domain-containing protein
MRLRLALLCATFVGLASALTVSALADRPARTAQEAECIEHPLGPVDQFTLIIHGDLVQDEEGGTDSEGRIAVGGDARLRNYGVATRWPEEPTRVDLAVGGDLSVTNVNAARGSVTYGGALTGNVTVANNGGTITQRRSTSTPPSTRGSAAPSTGRARRPTAASRDRSTARCT